VDELATRPDVTAEKVREMQQDAREPVSLDQTIGEEGDSCLGDFTEDSQAVVSLESVSFAQMRTQPHGVLSDRDSRHRPAEIWAHRRSAPHAG
jgi:DNA-directed RNA polymerase sigma subunit (sigma70/sigma32)